MSALHEAVTRAITDAEQAREAAVDATPQRSHYGERECGCTWDSGPYSVYCEAHTVDVVAVAVGVVLAEAKRSIEALPVKGQWAAERMQAEALAVLAALGEQA